MANFSPCSTGDRMAWAIGNNPAPRRKLRTMPKAQPFAAKELQMSGRRLCARLGEQPGVGRVAQRFARTLCTVNSIRATRRSCRAADRQAAFSFERG